MIRIGIAGIGFMGMIHYLAYQRVPGAQVTAIASRDPKKRAGDWRGIQGNFGPPGEQMDLGEIQAYETIEQLLADPNIDVVDITLPPFRHAEVAIAALQAGKHVFCEKPLTLTADSAQNVVDVAKECGRMLMVGHVLPFFPEYQWARATIESGKYGRLLGGHFRRVVSDPAWLESYWEPDLVGGPMLDLHVHDAHFIRYLFGMPQSVVTRGRMKGECAQSWLTMFNYASPDLVVTAASGTIGQQGRPFLHGFEIHLEEATLTFEFAVVGDEGKYLCAPVLFGPDGKATLPELGDGDPLVAFENQLTEVTDCLQNNTPSKILGGELASDAIKLCHLQTQSLVALGQPITV